MRGRVAGVDSTFGRLSNAGRRSAADSSSNVEPLAGGGSPAELSRNFALQSRTARGLLGRWRSRGEAGLAPDFKPRFDPATVPRPTHSAFAADVDQRRAHPRWGAGRIRVALLGLDLGKPPPDGPSSGGSAALGSIRRRRDDIPTSGPSGPTPYTRPGRSTPPRKWPWPAAPQAARAVCCRVYRLIDGPDIRYGGTIPGRRRGGPPAGRRPSPRSGRRSSAPWPIGATP